MAMPRRINAECSANYLLRAFRLLRQFAARPGRTQLVRWLREPSAGIDEGIASQIHLGFNTGRCKSIAYSAEHVSSLAFTAKNIGHRYNIFRLLT
jgi:hypothetical protein